MSDEFPTKSDDAALLNLARAILAEGTAHSTGMRQAGLADEYGARCGFRCSTDTARAGLGAFIDDLIKLDGPRDVSSMVISFQRWYGTDAEAASLAEFGCDEEPSTWLNGRMEALAEILWDAGSVSPRQDRDAAWQRSQTSPTPRHSHQG